MAEGSILLMSSRSVESFSLMLLGLVIVLFTVGVWAELKEGRRLSRRARLSEEDSGEYIIYNIINKAA